MARKKKKVTRKKKATASSSKNMCMHCGASCCGCKSYTVIKGALLLFLGILLWAGVFDLKLTVALLLILFGVKKIANGVHY